MLHDAELIAVFARWGDWSTTDNEDIQMIETLARPPPGRLTVQTHPLKQLEAMSGSGYPKFRNDRGVPEICIGVKGFECIGVSPPHDHPHIYINMREADTILCPYCATQFRFDPQMTPLEAEPPDSVFS